MGPELVTNGSFNGNANGWLLPQPGSMSSHYSSNSVILDTNNTSSIFLEQDTLNLDTISTYLVTFIMSVPPLATGTFEVKLGVTFSSPFDLATYAGAGPKTFSFPIIAAANNGILEFVATSSLLPIGTTFTYVSVRNLRGNLYLQNTFMVGSDPDGDVQTVNAGKSDDGTPIYFELETQEIDFMNETTTSATVNNIPTSSTQTQGSRVHLKKIADKIIVFTNFGVDSQIQANADGGDWKPILMQLGERVNLGKNLNLEGHFFTFKWFGESSETSPVFEGLYLEDVTDLGMTDS